MTIPDPIADLRAILLADTTVEGLVGAEGVYHSELPDVVSSTMPKQAVVLAQAGGQGRYKTLKARTLRLDTICYGATLFESYELHQAVREVLETLAKRSNSVISAETISDGANARDPLKQWPVCFASYRLLTTTTV